MRNKEQTTEFFNVFGEYNEIISKPNFIDFNQLMTSILFKNNLGFESKIYLDLLESFNIGIEKKYDFIYENFIITFNINLKYGTKMLVPMIANLESSNNNAINLKPKTENEQVNKVLIDLNSEINKSLSAGNSVEIMPNVVVYLAESTNQLKLVFNLDVVNSIKN